MITKPLLAGKVEDIETLNYPVLATPKLDGIRCLKVDGKVVTRKFKPLPNNYIRECLEKILPDGIDGEIMINGETDFNKIQSGVMRSTGEPDFVYCAFDYVKDDLDKPYTERMKDLKEFQEEYLQSINEDPRHCRITSILPIEVKDQNFLMAIENIFVAEGYEGVMVRSPEGRYKCGRSTTREGILLKLKRFFDAEATVVGFQEKMSNQNAAEKDAFGRTKRSSKKEGKVPANTLGALEVRTSIPFGKNTRGSQVVEFNLGTGFDDALRKEIWENKDKYEGQLVKYKYQELSKDNVPRFPVFLGFRHEDDLS